MENEEQKERDERLKAAGVHFLPWVGSGYENGIGYDEYGFIQYGMPEKKGKKVLVLGESHYCADEKDAIPDLTRLIIEDFIQKNTKFEAYKNTYIKFERALAGKILDIEKGEREILWNHVAFYNYVQKAITAPRFAPYPEQFIASEGAFWEVLSLYRPDIVIVWGKRLYINLPQKGMQGKDVIIRNGEYENETWIYELENKKITIFPIASPSSAFRPSFWCEFIVKLFNVQNNE